MLQCYVLTFGQSVTAFSAPPRSQRPGQMPRSPHPKAGPANHFIPRERAPPHKILNSKVDMSVGSKEKMILTCCTRTMPVFGDQ
jgi:hypothetical protein